MTTPTLKQLHQDVQECKSNIHKRLDDGATRMAEMKADVCANTKAMEDMTKSFDSFKESLDTFILLWNTGAGAFRFGKGFGKFIMWLGALVAALGAILHLGDQWK